MPNSRSSGEFTTVTETSEKDVVTSIIGIGIIDAC